MGPAAARLPMSAAERVFDPDSSDQVPILLDIGGMSCASCAGRVERALNKVDGVTKALVNLATETASVSTSGLVDATTLVEAVRSAGYEAARSVPATDPTAQAVARRSRHEGELARRRQVLAFGVLGSVTILVADYGFGHAPWSPWVQLAVAVPVWALVGWIFHRGALRAARHTSVNMDTLVSLGSTVALVYSVVAVVALGGRPTYFDVAALIVTLIAVGKYLEVLARGRAGEAIEALAGLQPDIAHLLARQGAPGEHAGESLVGSPAIDVPVASLRPGDVVTVRPGDRIPTDAIVIAGAGWADESMLTGEPVPVPKHPEDQLTGGTVNGLSPLVARVIRVGADTTLAQILHLVEQAQTEKSNAQRLADRVSSVFVPVILALALLTFVGWIATGHAAVEALVPAVAVLVVACPCALGLATPVAVLVGTSRGAACGLLVRGGEALERVRSIEVVILDKTGTLTLGRPEVTALDPLDGSDGREALGAAASLEAASEHPLARAVLAEAASRGAPTFPVTQVEVTPGGGISGAVDGSRVCVGSIGWLASTGVEVALGGAGPAVACDRTTVGVAIDGRLRLLLYVADPIREHAAAGVAHLRAQGLNVVLASGDSEPVARAVAAVVGIDEVHAPLRPEEKLSLVTALRERYGQVAMVGDGINDAPALAAADVGIAIGSGTGAAMAAADITLVHGDVGAVGDAIALSWATRRIVRQNLAWAFGYNAVLVPLAAFGILPPIFAALAMALSSVSVVSNALRLRRFPQLMSQRKEQASGHDRSPRPRYLLRPLQGQHRG